jgi:hypothetical protein
MQLTSSDIQQDQPIAMKHVFDGFGCTGQNITPLLSWSDPPAGTQSFALTVYDPDAPTGSGWWHWIAYNLPAASRSNDMLLRAPNQAQLEGGIRQALNDYGTYSYGGPCPPQGHPPHRYIFTVHALKVPSIDAPEGATCAVVRFMILANALASATLEARFGR